MHQLARRKVLLWGGAIAGGALLPAKIGLDWYAYDEAVNHFAYPGDESPIVTLGYDGIAAADLPHAESGTLIYAGLGQHPEVARKMAQKLAAATYKDRRVSYNEYAGQGLRVDNQADEYEALEETVTELDLFLNSMGSITWANAMGEKHRRFMEASSVQAARQVSNQRNPHAPVRLRTVTFCSSPFDAHDVYQETAVRAIAGLGLNGTLTEKFLAKMVLNINSDRNYRDFKELLEAASQETFDALPPKMWASQVFQLGTTSIKDFASAYRGAITPDTLVLYLRPKRGSDDRVVKVDQAQARMGRFFTEQFNTDFKVVEMPGAGHADIDKACECAQFEDLLNAKSGFSI